MIRRASYVADAEANADTALILRLLQGTPNPPNETEENIGGYINDLKEYHFIDTTRQAAIRMVVDEVADNEDWDQQIVVVWWMAERDVRPNMIPVMAACSRKVLTDFPAAASWPTLGQFPANPALSDIAQDAASKADAESYRTAFPSVIVERDKNSKWWRGRSTLQEVVDSAEALVR